MPIYEYECSSCKKIIEIMKSFSDTTLPICTEEKCGMQEMQKIISSNSFILKGKSWARDGYTKR